jgi:hypothetical protein
MGDTYWVRHRERENATLRPPDPWPLRLFRFSAGLGFRLLANGTMTPMDPGAVWADLGTRVRQALR